MKRRCGLAVLDLDGTLCDSPPVVGGDYAAWERAIAASPPPLVDGARPGVGAILGAGLEPIVLSARSERIRAATRVWIDAVFPGLRGVDINLRAPDDSRPSVLSKLERLEAYRRQREGRVLLVDDDPAMRHAVREGDVFALAPGCWWFLRSLRGGNP